MKLEQEFHNLYEHFNAIELVFHQINNAAVIDCLIGLKSRLEYLELEKEESYLQLAIRLDNMLNSCSKRDINHRDNSADSPAYHYAIKALRHEQERLYIQGGMPEGKLDLEEANG